MDQFKNLTPQADFDWDAYAKGDAMSKEEREQQTALYDGTLNQVKDKEVMMGKIISMNKREVVVNIGLKSLLLYGWSIWRRWIVVWQV